MTKLYKLCVVLQDKLFVSGGSCTGVDPRSFRRLNFAVKNWTQLASMTVGRSYHAMASDGAQVYVCGGYDGSKPLSSCERWSQESNSWTAFTDLPDSRKQLRMVSVGDGRLLVAGGYACKGDDCVYTTSILYYSEETKTWSISHVALPKKADFCCANHDLTVAPAEVFTKWF